jgi:glutamate synthase (NADPH/NADH) small chain
MGHVTGFLDHERHGGGRRPVAERLADWREVAVPLPESELREQASRCMDCGTPWCHAVGCPLANLVPEWNDLAYRGQWREAWVRLEMTNNFPELTGRLCPALCEAACTLSLDAAAVTVRELELAIIERAFAEGWVAPRPARRQSGRRVAVVGSGPAGLAAAQQLARAGHAVTVFESAARAGGLLRYGIPEFKLEKRVIDRRLRQLDGEGVRFECGVTIGEDISARYLRHTFDAVLLAMGARQPRALGVPGADLAGVHQALDYLSQANRAAAGEPAAGEAPVSARGNSVLVIGGGDTGSDCVGTARRQGARDVLQFEIMPKPPEWAEARNPNWPWWPTILRTSSSHEEGCLRDWGVDTVRLEGANGRLARGHFRRVSWADGRMTPVAGSEFSLEIDMVLLAMGFLHVCHDRLVTGLDVELDGRGNLRTDGAWATSQPGVFAAGDAATGASLVVRAIASGRGAAAAVDRYLGE